MWRESPELSVISQGQRAWHRWLVRQGSAHQVPDPFGEREAEDGRCPDLPNRLNDFKTLVSLRSLKSAAI
jgi:hypothetical protein